MNIPYMILNTALISMVAVAFVTDMKRSIIPNRLTMTGMIGGLVYHTLIWKWDGFKFSLAGCMTGFGILLMIYFLGALGAGDVKFFGAVGSLYGTQFVLYGILFSILYAGLIGLIVFLYQKKLSVKAKQLLYKLIGLWCSKDIRGLISPACENVVSFPFMYAALPGIITAYIHSL